MEFSIVAFYALFAGSVGYALFKGGAPERYGAIAHLVLMALEVTALQFVRETFATADPTSLVVDVLVLLAYGSIALHANRLWPLWAASLSLLSVLSHFARWVQVAIHPYAYVLLSTLPTAMSLLAMAIGTMNYHRRIKAGLPCPDWVDWRAIGRRRSAAMAQARPAR